MRKFLIIGGSGFVGKRLAKSLLASGQSVRCMARDQARVKDLVTARCECVQGDIIDKAAVLKPVDGMECVKMDMHSVSAQSKDDPAKRLLVIERTELHNFIAACRNAGLKRVIYLSSLGADVQEASEWLRERGHTEDLLLTSGLDAIVIRPGMVVGAGGQGFEMMLGNAMMLATIKCFRSTS